MSHQRGASTVDQVKEPHSVSLKVLRYLFQAPLPSSPFHPPHSPIASNLTQSQTLPPLPLNPTPSPSFYPKCFRYAIPHRLPRIPLHHTLLLHPQPAPHAPPSLRLRIRRRDIRLHALRQQRDTTRSHGAKGHNQCEDRGRDEDPEFECADAFGFGA